MATRIERNRSNIANRSRNNLGTGAATGTNETATQNAVTGAGDDGANQDSGNGSSRDRETDRMGSIPSFTQADFQPEFRISVRPPPGGTKTPVPALFDDWHGATLDAAAKERGVDELAPELGQARNDAEKQLGRPLERWEVRQVDTPVLKALLPPIRARHYAAITQDSGSKQQAIDSSLKNHGQRLQKARDPFTPLALGDPAARAKDRVLWENPKFMVIVDSFSPGPKALVIPKQGAMFPTNISKNDLEEMAKIAAKVSDAFGKAAGSGPASIWVNPPQRLTIKQLHTHVLPKLPHWENPGPGAPGGRDPRSDVPAHIVAEMDQFHTALEAELAKAL